MIADINTEIRRIVEFCNTSLSLSEQKNENEISVIIKDITEAYKQNTYDFSKFESLTLR